MSRLRTVEDKIHSNLLGQGLKANVVEDFISRGSKGILDTLLDETLYDLIPEHLKDEWASSMTDEAK